MTLASRIVEQMTVTVSNRVRSAQVRMITLLSLFLMGCNIQMQSYQSLTIKTKQMEKETKFTQTYGDPTDWSVADHMDVILKYDKGRLLIGLLTECLDLDNGAGWVKVSQVWADTVEQWKASSQFMYDKAMRESETDQVKLQD